MKMMNCIKKCGVSWTTWDIMVVRDQTSEGKSTIFWKHNLQRKEYEEVERKDPNGCDENEFGRVVKFSIALDYHHASGVYPFIQTPPVQGDVTHDAEPRHHPTRHQHAPLIYNQTKGLTSRSNEKIAWATTLLTHPHILNAYEEGLHESEEDQQQTNQEHQPPNNTEKQPPHQPNAKGKCPPMERHVPDPLK